MDPVSVLTSGSGFGVDPVLEVDPVSVSVSVLEVDPVSVSVLEVDPVSVLGGSGCGF